jgi:predicted lysophospholipase L1 biosynthesis ABC-type transport system permease subunit
VVEVHAAPGLTIPGSLLGFSPSDGFAPDGLPAGLVSCAQLAQVPAFGRCPAGAAAVAFPTDSLYGTTLAGITWPAADIPAGGLASHGLLSLYVATNGSVTTVERARSMLEAAYPTRDLPATLGEWNTQAQQKNNQYQQLADVVILTSLPIAGCTLAASVAAGLADRKRPFSLLRLAGAPLGVLRRVVALESAVPLLVTAVVSIGVGFGASAMFATSQLRTPLVAPNAAYYVITAAGIVASLGIIATTMPLLRRITGPDVARNE